MSHVDDETIALAALGEEIDEASAAHLDACAQCQAELASLSQVVMVGRSVGGAEQLISPPPAVWARIAAETGVDPALLPTSLDARRDLRAGTAGAPNTGTAGDGSADDLTPRSTDADADDAAVRRGEAPGVTTLRPPADRGLEQPRSRWSGFLVAASVAGLLLGVGGTLAWQALQDDPDVVAAAQLDPLPDKVGTGAAEVVDTDAGRELELTLDTAPPPDAFLQVWLLSPDAERMVPIGVLAGDSGHWTLPPDVTLADYPVVDVSIEPYDGEPTHSGDSVVRGSLDLTGDASAALP